MNRILTIGIPTYNRSQTLSLMLSTLIEDIGDLSSKVSIIISNNASTDNTKQVIENWQNTLPADVDVEIVHNKENIGASKNVISLFYKASTPYFMFLGDDDRLVSENFRKIIDILERDDSPSAIIQSLWGDKLRYGLSGDIPYSAAIKLFYEYGNAWAGIVNCKAAVQAIEKRKLRAEIEKIVWPQTVMGFLAMHDLIPQKVYAADFEIGMPLSPGLNITNKQYWIRSLSDLLKAGLLIENGTNSKLLRSSFLRLSNFGFYGHLRSIFRSSLIADHSSPDYDLRKILSRNFGIQGTLYAGLLKIGHHPRILYALLNIAYRLKNGLGNSGFKRKVEELRKEYDFEVSQIEKTKKRMGDWF